MFLVIADINTKAILHIQGDSGAALDYHKSWYCDHYGVNPSDVAVGKVAALPMEMEGAAAVIENGEVQSIEALPGPTERYVAVEISGNSGFASDGTLTFVPGDTIAITMTLKTGPEAGAATWPYSTPAGVALSVPYRKNGAFAGRMRCPFVNGVCNFNFPVTDDMHGDLSIEQADLTPFGGNLVVLLDTVEISVEKASA